MVSLKVSDFFEGNSTFKTLSKFDDHQTSPSLGLKNFLDGLTESVRLFRGKFYLAIYELLILDNCIVNVCLINFGSLLFCKILPCLYAPQDRVA